jgi:MFS family permease
MQLFNNYHHHKIYKMLHSDFWLFDLSIWIHVFARSLVAVFIPIFLLQMGFLIEEVLLYYIILHLTNVPLNFWAGWLTRRIGARKVIIVGVVFLILFFASLYNLEVGNWWLLAMMAVFASLYDAHYWVAHIFFFMKCSDKDDNVSKDASALSIVKQFAGILAPFFGALVLIFFTQKTLLGISILILCLSFWPLFKIKDIDDKPKGKGKTIKEFFSDWKTSKEYLFLALYSIHSSVESTLWPIFIFMLFESLESVAALPIIISLSTIIFTYLTSHIDKKNRNTMIALGAVLIAITWIFRMYVDNTIFYYFSVFLVAFFTILITLPLDSQMFENGEKKDALDTSMYRNTISMSARVILLIVLFVMVKVFEVGFIAAAVSMFVLMIVNLLFRVKGVSALKKSI